MSGTYSPEESALVASLVALSARYSKLVKSTAYGTTIDGSEAKIRTWKMNGFKYYDIPSPFPTLAQGLFTRELVTDGAMKSQIVVRWYDKFFNIGEVPWAAVRSLFFFFFVQDVDLNPSGHLWKGIQPYIPSQIEWMYIIFIATVTPAQLVVTSKHSIGAVDSSVQSQSTSHPQPGSESTSLT